MSTKLQQVAKSSKVETLPDDLKSIAEQMLAEKFGEPEVVAAKPDPFRGYVPADEPGYAGPDDVFRGSTNSGGRRYQGRDLIQVEVQPWDGRRVAKIMVHEPTERSLTEALYIFDNENVPNRDRAWIMSPRFWHYIQRDPTLMLFINLAHPMSRARVEGEIDVVAEMFGVRVVMSRNVGGCLLTSTF